jgi:hypothetical protein
MSKKAVVAAVTLLATAWPASAAPTNGWQIRGIEKDAIELKALELHSMVPRTGTHVTLRKPINKNESLYCGVLRPKANPSIDVYFSAIVTLTKVVSFDVDTEELGKVYQFCREIDMSMP